MSTEQASSFLGRDFIADRGLAASPVYLTDMDSCVPADSLSRESQRGYWKMYDYETSGFSGVLLMVGPETDAPDITYPLNVTGWHAVSIGIHPTDRGQSEQSRLLAKLSDEETYVDLTWQPDGHLSRQRLEEIYWKTADLTGQQVQLRQFKRRRVPGDEPGAVQCGAARVAYIKLVPLSEAEVQALQADRNNSASRRLYAHSDTDWAISLGTVEGIQSVIEPYRNSDFSRMYWESGSGDLIHHPTKVGRTPDSVAVPDFARHFDRFRDEGWLSFVEQGIDPFQAAIDHTHEIGLEFHASYRLAGWTYPPPLLDYLWVGGFFNNHPEWHCVDREGMDVPRMSYAYREVQDMALAVLREAASYAIEGVCLLYNRRPPYVYYEQPLIDGFKAAHGEDPRQVPEDDPTWLSYRAGVMTEFMRRLRGEMDAVSREQGRGRHVEVSVCVLGKEEDNLHFGLDIPTWVREGLIDTLIPYSPAPLAMPVETDTWSEASQIKPFVDATRGSECILAPNVMPRQMSPEDFRRMADMLYGAGAEHMFFWDCEGRSNYKASWNALRRLGHKDEIEEWTKAGEPPLSAPLTRLRTLGGWNMEAIAPG